MKKKGIILWGIACMFAYALAGCGGEGEISPKAEAPEESQKEENGFVYVAEYGELAEDGYGVGNAVVGEDGTVFYTKVNEEGTKLAARKMDGGKAEIPVELGENTTIGAIGKDAAWIAERKRQRSGTDDGKRQHKENKAGWNRN